MKHPSNLKSTFWLVVVERFGGGLFINRRRKFDKNMYALQTKLSKTSEVGKVNTNDI